jgi:hypothetical protein
MPEFQFSFLKPLANKQSSLLKFQTTYSVHSEVALSVDILDIVSSSTGTC